MAVLSSGQIANIGSRERRKRLVFGVAALALSVVISFLFVFFGVPPVWRLPIIIPLFFGSLGYFQARDKT